MLKLLIKINFMRIFMSRKRKGNKQTVSVSGKGTIIGYSALAVFMMIGFAGMAMGISIAAEAVGAWFFCEVAAAAAFLIMFVGSIFYAVTALFDAKDNDLLLSMPIKPGDIVLSRLLSLFILNCIYAYSVIFPFTAVGTLTGVLSWWQAILLFFGSIFNILGTIGVICLIAWVISQIISRVKRKQIVQVLLMLLAFGLYMVIYPNIGRFISASIDDPEHFAEIAKGLYPFYLFGQGCGGNLLSLLIFAVCASALAYLAYYLIKKSFVNVITRNTTAKKQVYKAGKTTVRGTHKALVFKEIRRFTGSAVYMFNAGLGLLLMIAFGIFMVVVLGGMRDPGTALLELEGFTLTPELAAALMTAALIFISSMTMISAPSVSLEGKMLWVLRSSPVSGRDVLTAKADAHIVICLPFIVVTSVICAIATLDFLGMLLMIVTVTAATAFMAHAGVVANMLFPRFDNESDSRTVKQSGAVVLAMIIGMVFAIVVSGIGAGVYFASNAYAAMLAVTAICALASLGLRLLLAYPLAKKFDTFPA